MFIVPGVPLPALIPEKTEPAPLMLQTMLPVEFCTPMLFGVVLPQLNPPVAREIPL